MSPRMSAALAACLLAVCTQLACSGGGGGGGAPAGATGGVGAASAGGAPVVALQVSADLPPAIAARARTLIGQAARRPVVALGAGDDGRALPAGSLLIAIGDGPVTRRLIPTADVAATGSEGFVVRSRTEGAITAIAADGNPAAPDPYGLGLNAGLSYGAYALLEELGFAFLHPLAPTVPDGLAPDRHPVDLSESPYWPFRCWHLHTTHPLELTHVSQGWGPAGPGDAAGWRSLLPEWELFCEWLVANRQNRLEWVLLYARSWAAFADGPERIARLAELVRIGHAYGIGVGIDAPLAQKQQHNFPLIRRAGDLADELDQLRARLDLVMGAGFDFVATELGFSEFTHAEDTRVLAWIDEAVRHLHDAHGGARLYVKAHNSAELVAPNFPDPRDPTKPINFNFLTHYADSRAGVRPHTVQHYALDDPAPTYGLTDFAFMRDFMRLEAGRREVIWHPETAYWVSFDVDVPLFLPVYAERRLHDLRLIADDERSGRMGAGALAGSRIQGQSNFSSGWEWGYWLNDVVTARAAWDPQPAEPDDRAALGRALDPVVRPFGPAADATRDALIAAMRDQHELLILGRVNGAPPRKVHKRNGQAYLQGWDSFDELAAIAGRLPFLPIGPLLTQPVRHSFTELRFDIPFVGPDYVREIDPLLAEMERAFDAHADALEGMKPRVPAHARPLFDDLADAARVTALRARQVHGLYDYVHLIHAPAAGRPRLADARAALDEAARVVARREAAYRADPDRIAGWGENPTAYEFGYLWTARSLHYWWRDEGLAVDAAGPGYLNIIDPIDVAFGEGIGTAVTRVVRAVGPALGAQDVTDLLSAPATEPTYPPAGLRSRP